MIRFWLRALGLLLLFAAPAHAAFTTEEKAEVEKFIAGVQGVNHGLITFASTVRDEEATTNATLVRSAMLRIAGTLNEAHLMLAYMGGQGAQNFARPTLEGRAQKVASSMFHAERTGKVCDDTVALMQSFVTDIAKLARSRIAAGCAKFKSFNRTLAYTSPNPGPGVQIVGPHGDYDLTIWHLQRGFVYWQEMFKYVFTDYPGNGVTYYTVMQSAPPIWTSFVGAFGRAWDVDTSQTEKEMRAKLATLPAGEFGVPFWLVGRRAEIMSRERFADGGFGVPTHYHVVNNAIAKGTGPNILEAREKLSDSWRHNDSAFWFLFGAFPGCNMNEDPMGCAAKLPSQQKTSPPATLTGTAGDGKSVTYTLAP